MHRRITPSNHQDVEYALAAYGVIFEKTIGQANVNARLDLLAYGFHGCTSAAARSCHGRFNESEEGGREAASDTSSCSSDTSSGDDVRIVTDRT